MYTQLYGLKERPFNMTPDPRFIYYSASHRECLAQMIYGVNNRRGFVVVTGEVGTGKTTLIRTLLEKVNSKTRIAYLYHAILGVKSLFQSILRDFQIPFDSKENKTDLLYKLKDLLFSLYRNDENAVLIIDEAQTLKPHILEEIRLISNIETSDRKLIQILLVGQPEFAKILERNEVRPLKQRIALRFHITPLSMEETGAYINHRLRIAGYNRRIALFTSEAIEEIYQFSQGIPRAINILCDNALIMGYTIGADQITPRIVGQVRFPDEYGAMNDLSFSDPEEIEIRTIASESNILTIQESDSLYVKPGDEDSLFKRMVKNWLFK
ncbi:AAA family ATPase [candidate division KSB1 bacterium]|nr:AAA family ATPase [candidate division KSB1 bacterium]